MARITVEDCLDNVDNRFELVLLATKRARQLAHGQEAMVDWDNDKVTVVALREIASNLINNDNIAAQNIVEEEAEIETVPEVTPSPAAPDAE